MPGFYPGRLGSSPRGRTSANVGVVITKTCAIITALLVATVLLVASPAAADHIHSKKVGNDKCVLLTLSGGEGDVVLPDANPNVDPDAPENRKHPMHVLVHTGRPGENFEIEVFGTPSDPCFESGVYVNLRP